MNIYLDYAATTPVDESVFEYMKPYLTERFGNPSSVHYHGKNPKVIVEEAREEIAFFLGVKPKEIFFTGCGTESNNTAIKGLAFANLGERKNHIITDSIEHPAVLETVQYLGKFGFYITVIKPDKFGFVSPDVIDTYIADNTLLVSVMHANNELGTLNDIKSISEICRRKKVYFHSDTVQSVGKTELNLKDSGVHFASLSAHKIYGPKGVGVLYISEEVEVDKIDKLIHGGSQERNMRGGTENVAGIAGLRKAVSILKSDMNSDIENSRILKEHFIKNLTSHYGENVIINSPSVNSLDNIINISFNPYSLSVPEGMLPLMLDLRGISVSGGSACSSGSLKPSKVLTEIIKDERTVLSSIRISTGRYSKIEDMDALLSALKDIVKKI